MHVRSILLTGALVLVSGAATAQTPTPQASPQLPQTPPQGATGQTPPSAPAFGGTIDIGGLFTGTDGDEARYERYRDMRNGLYSTFTLQRQDESYRFDATGFHVGYRDQRYGATFLGRRVNADFRFVGQPLNYSYITLTPYERSAEGVLTLSDDAQRAVQGPTNAPNDGTAVGVPCAPGAPPASCSTPALADLAKANRSIYNSLGNTFDLEHLRNTAQFGIKLAATRSVDIDAQFSSSGRHGEQPWGASFAFNDAVELPLPIDQRTNDFRLGASWASDSAMFRLGWDGSWFDNNVKTLVWDNPIRATDFNNGRLPPAGPYDPSAYVNGNGPAQGREALAPSNTMNVVSATGNYRLARRTSVNGTLQFTSQNQDEALIPFTINSVINNTPAVIAAFPNLASLPRTSAQAEAKGVNALINLSSRPARGVNFTVRYRFNDRDVRTPTFDATEYVRFDAVPEEIEEGLSHQFDTSRHVLDASVSFAPATWGTLRLGYGHEDIERHGRGFSDVGENVFRVSFDTFSMRLLTIRAAVDIGRRRGTGFVEAESGNDEGPGGTQPTLRYYDEADRDRTRGSLVVTFRPRDSFDVFFQLAGWKDEYMADDYAPVSRPGEYFGLLESTVTSWTVGTNFYPTDIVTMGVNYGHENYGSFQRSRNADPPPSPTWTDPARDWTLDNADRTNNFSAFLDLIRALRNTDIHFSYDYSDSGNNFNFGGPRIAGLSAIGQFIPLPNVENAWHRANADVQYFFAARAGIGIGYYFEKLSIKDFNTIDSEGPVGFAPQTEVPRIEWLGGLITGYGNRPYTGNTGYIRLLYRF